MSDKSKIEWTDATFNIVWGCQRVSPACEHCYAEAFSKRLGKDLWGPNKERQVMSESYWQQPLKWNRYAEKTGVRKRVFCSSMADVFEDHPTVNAERWRLWELIVATSNLDWLLLTKRPENMAKMLPAAWGNGYSNVWLGITVENQKYADERIPLLLQTPAAVRFLSCEPLLGAIDLSEWLYENDELSKVYPDVGVKLVDKIHLVIVGGESGAGFRPMNLDHARALRGQCICSGIPFFFKQVGGVRPTSGGDLLDGVQWHEMPKIAE